MLQTGPLVKSLYADAGSGVVFNLSGQLTIGGETIPEGVIVLPAQTKAETIALAPNSQIAGIRFHPAIGFGLLGKHYEKPTILQENQIQPYDFYRINSKLLSLKDNSERVDALLEWAREQFDIVDVIPDDMECALDSIRQGDVISKLSEKTKVSQRHIERHFKHWLGMTPKHYQRILRIKKAVGYLRQHRGANLAEVAHTFGFSDQAHMTREFRTIARLTPKQV
ncbi:helix-turn-helix domain-containing protein [Vibrio sonorensis]|uniref:helix-turn-helix domain-containing protein n=1 Tax=Vibrio sonorensis TaxID=1004316 RepID=UPI0008D96F0F|nr:helix-turn-helix domain-containing protein [Vibrio sonorensis]